MVVLRLIENYAVSSVSFVNTALHTSIVYCDYKSCGRHRKDENVVWFEALSHTSTLLYKYNK